MHRKLKDIYKLQTAIMHYMHLHAAIAINPQHKMTHSNGLGYFLEFLHLLPKGDWYIFAWRHPEWMCLISAKNFHRWYRRRRGVFKWVILGSMQAFFFLNAQRNTTKCNKLLLFIRADSMLCSTEYAGFETA